MERLSRMVVLILSSPEISLREFYTLATKNKSKKLIEDLGSLLVTSFHYRSFLHYVNNDEVISMKWGTLTSSSTRWWDLDLVYSSGGQKHLYILTGDDILFIPPPCGQVNKSYFWVIRCELLHIKHVFILWHTLVLRALTLKIIIGLSWCYFCSVSIFQLSQVSSVNYHSFCVEMKKLVGGAVCETKS